MAYVLTTAYSSAIVAIGRAGWTNARAGRGLGPQIGRNEPSIVWIRCQRKGFKSVRAQEGLGVIVPERHQGNLCLTVKGYPHTSKRVFDRTSVSRLH